MQFANDTQLIAAGLKTIIACLTTSYRRSAYRENCVFINDENANNREADRISVKSTQKHVYLQHTTHVVVLDMKLSCRGDTARRSVDHLKITFIKLFLQPMADRPSRA